MWRGWAARLKRAGHENEVGVRPVPVFVSLGSPAGAGRGELPGQVRPRRPRGQDDFVRIAGEIIRPAASQLFPHTALRVFSFVSHRSLGPGSELPKIRSSTSVPKFLASRMVSIPTVYAAKRENMTRCAARAFLRLLGLRVPDIDGLHVRVGGGAHFHLEAGQIFQHGGELAEAVGARVKVRLLFYDEIAQI